jgi:hypothetical protein
MMWMDPSRPELQDVTDAVKDVFRQFDISAVRADDIEHEGVITLIDFTLGTHPITTKGTIGSGGAKRRGALG